MSLLSKSTIFAFSLIVLSCFSESFAQTSRRAPAGGMRAVVIDERLAALRDEPSFAARLLQRMSRGRTVAVLGQKRASEGVTFYRVAVTRRTRGWLQSEAVVVPGRAGEDDRLLRLIRGSEDFDRLARARIFLDIFPRSPLRASVLRLYGEEAEAAAVKLSRDAARRLEEREIAAGGAPPVSYFMNYNGLDRYRRQDIVFTFDPARKQYHYDGAAWREILRRYPDSPEAIEARKRLEALASVQSR
jgi:hypothetical protein